MQRKLPPFAAVTLASLLLSCATAVSADSLDDVLELPVATSQPRVAASGVAAGVEARMLQQLEVIDMQLTAELLSQAQPADGTEALSLALYRKPAGSI